MDLPLIMFLSKCGGVPELDYGRNQRWRQLIFYKQGANFASILEKKGNCSASRSYDVNPPHAESLLKAVLISPKINLRFLGGVLYLPAHLSLLRAGGRDCVAV